MTVSDFDSIWTKLKDKGPNYIYIDNLCYAIRLSVITLFTPAFNRKIIQEAGQVKYKSENYYPVHNLQFV